MPKEDWNIEAVKIVVPKKNGLEKIERVLRTPDERFKDLPDWPYHPLYVTTHVHGQVRIHYIDEGPKDAKETLLLMHGEPTWGYLYRHMIPPLIAAGFRVIVPDLVGFGRSDKPNRREDISFEREVDWFTEFLVTLRLDDITFFGQDWGGLIGLRVVARLPERFSRLAVSNTFLPTGKGANETFAIWASVISQKAEEWGPII